MTPVIDHPPEASPDRLPEPSPSDLIRRCRRERPSATPDEVAQWLGQFKVHLPPHVIDALLAAMKTG